jgi:cytochrome c biogenesis protein CcmG, thiol:disulfide interchange protein DsbE
VIRRINLSRVLPVLLFAGVAGALAMGLNRDPKVIPSMLLDRPIPQFELPALNAVQPGLNSAEFSGHGLVLVNVFASWCGSCRYEHPFLMRVAEDKRFTLVGMDWKDEAANANQYIATFGNPYSQIGIDASGRTGINLGVSGVPETFVIDNQGRVRLRVPGPMTPEIWKAEIEPLIQTADKSP